MQGGDEILAFGGGQEAGKTERSGVQEGRQSSSVAPVPTDSRNAQRVMRHLLRCDSGRAGRADQVLPVTCQCTPG